MMHEGRARPLRAFVACLASLALAAALVPAAALGVAGQAWAASSTTYDSTTHVASAAVSGTTTYYDSLAEAINAADASSTVTLLAATTVSSKIQVSKTVTLDLNGQTLTLDNSSNGSNSAARLLYITTSGDLTVKDSSATEDDSDESAGSTDESDGGTSASAASDDDSSGESTDEDAADSTSGSGCIKNTGYSYGIFDVYGALSIESGNFVDQGSGDGALVRGRSKSTVRISGGGFEVSYYDYGNYSGKYVSNYYGDFVLNATSCAVSITGGSYDVGQYCWGALKLDTCTSADDDSDTVIVSGATITTYDSVGVECSLTDTTISSRTITVKNTSPIDGSPATAVGVSNQSVVTIKSGTYSGPYAVYVYNTGGTVTIEGGTYTGSKAALISDADIVQTYYDDDGNAVDDYEGSTIIVTGGTIDGAVVENSSSQAVAESTTTLSGGTYTSATALAYLAETSSYTAKTTTAEDDTETTTYTVTADAYVAKVTDSSGSLYTTTDDDGNTTNGYYADLQSALSAVPSSGSYTVTMLADVTITDGYLVISENLTFDLGDHELTFANSSTGKNDVGIYITDGEVAIKNGTITDKHSYGNTLDGTYTVWMYGDSLTTSSLTIQAYSPNSTSDYNYILYVQSNGAKTSPTYPSVTLDSGTSILDLGNSDSTASTLGCVGVTVKGAYATSELDSSKDGCGVESGKTVSLTVKDGVTITTDAYAIAGNGSCHGTAITIEGGKITSNTPHAITINGVEYTTGGTAIYHPQYGTLTITGGTIVGGSTGIEIRAGVLTMSGGSVTGQGAPTATQANGNGATSEGAGIAIAQHTTKLPISVTISGGTVSGYTAVYESNPQGNDDDSIALVSVAITGGTFESGSVTTTATDEDGAETTTTTYGEAVYFADDVASISGGSFSTAVDASYCAEGYSPTTAFTVTDADGNESSYYTVAQGSIEFWGGSLRTDSYATTDSSGQTSYDCTKADLRLGFCWDGLPDGATVTEFGWDYLIDTSGTYTGDSDVPSSALTDTLKGTNKREANPSTYSYDLSSSGTVANLVVTGIPQASFDVGIYARMYVTYSYTDDEGSTASVTIYSDVVGRDVLYVATGLSSSNDYAKELVSALGTAAQSDSSLATSCTHSYTAGATSSTSSDADGDDDEDAEDGGESAEESGSAEGSDATEDTSESGGSD